MQLWANAQTLSLTEKKQKSAIRGKVEGWGVQRGNRMEGGEVPTFAAVLLLLPLTEVSPLHKLSINADVTELL